MKTPLDFEEGSTLKWDDGSTEEIAAMDVFDIPGQPTVKPPGSMWRMNPLPVNPTEFHDPRYDFAPPCKAGAQPPVRLLTAGATLVPVLVATQIVYTAATRRFFDTWGTVETIFLFEGCLFLRACSGHLDPGPGGEAGSATVHPAAPRAAGVPVGDGVRRGVLVGARGCTAFAIGASKDPAAAAARGLVAPVGGAPSPTAAGREML